MDKNIIKDKKLIILGTKQQFETLSGRDEYSQLFFGNEIFFKEHEKLLNDGYETLPFKGFHLIYETPIPEGYLGLNIQDLPSDGNSISLWGTRIYKNIHKDGFTLYNK